MKSFTFTYNGKGPLPAKQSLTIFVADEATGQVVSDSVQAVIAPQANWITAVPISGTTAFTGQVGLSNAAKNISPGIYQTTLRVTSEQVTNSPQMVPVTLTITKGKR